MRTKAPNHFTTIPTFSNRNWEIVNKDFISFFPDPDIRSGETVTDALYRPIKGENVILEDIFDSTASGALASARTVRDDDFIDSGFQLTLDSSTDITVTGGYAIVMGVFVSINESFTVSLNDSTCFVDIPGGSSAFPAQADTNYFLVLHPYSVANDDLFDGADTMAISLMLADELEDFINTYPNIRGYFCILACITLNSSGQITSEDDFTYEIIEFWNREEEAFPPGPELLPAVNGGVIESDGEWYDDWL